ncbi:restriction endonuclease subunit S [Pelatocladus sp. BLCC-F211]|uniref:restriction endonuclease subunit S n=1 Tax=Pelatocladus sp. BLCC-F211 TaxID=3342752 RepID=UPI0035B7D860
MSCPYNNSIEAITDMSLVYPLVPLGKILIPVSRPEIVEPQVKYNLLGAHWYAEGLYTKEIKSGSQIQAKLLYKVEKGDFVYNRLFAWKGSFAIATEKNDGCYVSNEFPCFTLNVNKIDSQYLWRYFSRTSAWDEALSLSSGGTPTSRNRLKEEKLLSLEIPLPPLEEQRRIVARIEELVGKIEEVRSLRQKALEETEALLTSALNLTFEKNIDKQGWELKPLKQAAEVARGKFTHRPRNDPRFYGGNIPFIQIGDISNSNRYIREYSQTLNQDGLRISRMFPKGSIVIAITGATIGVTGILTFDSCFPDSIVGIVPNQDSVIPEFIYWSLEYVKKFALAEATQTTQPNINLQILDKLKIPVPTFPEQHRIVTYLDELQTKVDTMKRLRQEAMKELDALLPSILDKAFKGEL